MLTLHINGLHGKKTLPMFEGQESVRATHKNHDFKEYRRHNHWATLASAHGFSLPTSAASANDNHAAGHGSRSKPPMQPMGQIGHSWGASSPNMSIET
jgi:hypothetical protein